MRSAASSERLAISAKPSTSRTRSRFPVSVSGSVVSIMARSGARVTGGALRFRLPCSARSRRWTLRTARAASVSGCPRCPAIRWAVRIAAMACSIVDGARSRSARWLTYSARVCGVAGIAVRPAPERQAVNCSHHREYARFVFSGTEHSRRPRVPSDRTVSGLAGT
ncbi:hypothetical protein GXW82_34650 [Streptacidiphilus sp. 4-A2]|nr:hypothetical protein [Streptacidiphilus sp. 4-A2]